MAKHSFPFFLFSSIFLFLLVSLPGCKFHENNQFVIPTTTISSIGISTIIPLTATGISSSSETSTKIIPTLTMSTSIILPPSGEYIAYSFGKLIKLTSITGEDAGILMEGANEGRNWISPNQEIVAYSDIGHIIQFRFLYTGEIIEIHDQETCIFGVTNLSWGPEGDKIIVECGYSPARGDLKIISFPEGDIVGEINKIINTNVNGENYLYSPKWSPDGKWIAYFINGGGQLIGNRGPYITEASCITENENCTKKTTQVINKPYDYMRWTPENELSILDSANYTISIYGVPSFALKEEIKLPDEYWGADTFAWSRNGEMCAVATMEGILIISRKTGEIRHIKKQADRILFWIEVR